MKAHEHIDHAEALLEDHERSTDAATAIEAALHIGIAIAQRLAVIAGRMPT